MAAHILDGLHGIALVGVGLHGQLGEGVGEGVDGVHDLLFAGILRWTEDDSNLSLVAEGIVDGGLPGILSRSWQEVGYVLLIVQLQGQHRSYGKHDEKQDHGKDAVAHKVVVQAKQ